MKIRRPNSDELASLREKYADPSESAHGTRVLVSESLNQCQFAEIGFADLQIAMQGDRPETKRVWYSIQNFLVSTANVSKLLWPVRVGSAGRGKVLRDLLTIVDEDSPLRLRTLRDHFEHFDERLDQWAKRSERRIYIDSNIGQIEAFQHLSDPIDYHRNYDPSRQIVTFRSASYDLGAMLKEICIIRRKANEVLTG